LTLPSISEQAIISKVLRDENTKIHNEISKNKKLIELLKEKRQAIINQAVTKGLDPTAPMKDSGVEWIGEIPKHWDIRRLKEIGKLSAGGTPSTGITTYWENGTIPWISSGEVNNNIITEFITKITKLGLKESSTKLFPKGAVLLAITGQGTTRGRSAVLEIDACTNQSIVGIVIDHSKIFNYFLWNYLRSQYQNLRNHSHGSVQSGLNLDILRNYPIPITEINEQKQIADYLNKHTSKMDSLIMKVELQIKKLQEFRQSLISSAVTGKIDVRGTIA
jgi:type I restriction enzyme S subunit